MSTINKWQCTECKGFAVFKLEWKGMNTGEEGDGPIMSGGELWCNDCEDYAEADVVHIDERDELPEKGCFHCSTCGSEYVDQCEWRSLNTDEYKSEGPIDDEFCNDCDAHCGAVYVERELIEEAIKANRPAHTEPAQSLVGMTPP